MNVDLIPGYHRDIRTPSDGKPVPIYLAITTEGMDEPYPDFKALLQRDSAGTYYDEVLGAMKTLEMTYAPEQFDHTAKDAWRFRDALGRIIDNFPTTH